MDDSFKKKVIENLKPAAVRAVRTFIEVGIASIGGAVVFCEVNWGFVASASGLAALISFLWGILDRLPEVEGLKDKPKSEG